MYGKLVFINTSRLRKGYLNDHTPVNKRRRFDSQIDAFQVFPDRITNDFVQ